MKLSITNIGRESGSNWKGFQGRWEILEAYTSTVWHLSHLILLLFSRFVWCIFVCQMHFYVSEVITDSNTGHNILILLFQCFVADNFRGNLEGRSSHLSVMSSRQCGMHFLNFGNCFVGPLKLFALPIIRWFWCTFYFIPFCIFRSASTFNCVVVKPLM